MLKFHRFLFVRKFQLCLTIEILKDDSSDKKKSIRFNVDFDIPCLYVYGEIGLLSENEYRCRLSRETTKYALTDAHLNISLSGFLSIFNSGYQMTACRILLNHQIPF